MEANRDHTTLNDRLQAVQGRAASLTLSTATASMAPIPEAARPREGPWQMASVMPIRTLPHGGPGFRPLTGQAEIQAVAQLALTDTEASS